MQISPFFKITTVLLSLTITTSFTFASPKGAIPSKFFAGQMHYSRIPVEYWQHRIQMAKSLGLNALSVYVMWNYHQIEKGNFDYSSGNRNLSLFLELAQKHNMSVLMRPGPYVCAEWDLGGFPARLLAIDGLVLRVNNHLYLNEVKIYFESLAPIIKKHIRNEANPNGSIVLLQIQNEYGFYGNDKAYIQALRQIWNGLGVKCAEYYVDWTENLQKCHWEGANIGINGATQQFQYDYARTIEKKGVIFGGQIYSGWHSHWNQQWKSKSVEKAHKQYEFLMSHNHSYSMYMVHGGTNFGLTAGANVQKLEKNSYVPELTTYDYDAPINEQGSATEKYHNLRELLKKYINWDLPDIPNPIPIISIPPFKVEAVAQLFSNLGEGIQSEKVEVFESEKLKMFHQGIVVYSTTIKKSVDYFKIKAHDFGIVYLDNVYVQTVNRCKNPVQTVKVKCEKETCELKILVEAMGHINFGHQIPDDFKGIIEISDTKGAKFTWTMYPIEIDENVLNWSKMSGQLSHMPVLSKGQFNLSIVGDTYLDMSQFNKGYVWINGHNLGRYWKVGPQKRLFCPGAWMKEGLNNIYVLELLYDGVHSIQGKQSLK